MFNAQTTLHVIGLLGRCKTSKACLIEAYDISATRGCIHVHHLNYLKNLVGQCRFLSASYTPIFDFSKYCYGFESAYLSMNGAGVSFQQGQQHAESLVHIQLF